MSGSTQLLIVASRPLGGGSEYSEASEGCSLETGSADFALFEVCGSSPRTNERLRKTAEFLRGQTLRYLLWLHDNSPPNQETGPKIAKRSAAGKRTLTRAYCTVSSPAPSVQCPPHFHKRTQPPGLSGPGSIADIDWAGFSTETPRHG